MKVCVVITMNFPFGKGETFLENEVNYLSNGFDKVVFLAMSAQNNGQITRKIPNNVIAIPLNNISSKLRYPLYSFKGLLSASKEEKVEISSLSKSSQKVACYYASGRCSVTFAKAYQKLSYLLEWISIESCIFYSYWFMDQALLATKLAKSFSLKSKTASVSRAHRYDLYECRNTVNYIPYREIIFKSINGVFPCSKDGENYLIKKFPKYSPKISVSYLGTEDHGQSSASLIKDSFEIVTCSNIIDVKRVDIVLDAIRILREKQVRIHWHCIGDGPLLNDLQTKASKLDLVNDISFLGRLTNTEVVNFYKNNIVDLFVNVSSSEGLPVSIMEALSFGIPCLATDVGGTRELVSSDVGELLPENVNGVELAQSIKNVIYLDDIKSTKLRNNARQKWEQQHSASKNYTEWSKILHSTIREN